ncbi:MAG: O-antigen ligase family protein [bacterium]|nr:O-antigen ligase family protein [bacterium]
MKLYKYLTYLLLFLILFFPKQLDQRIIYSLAIFSVLLIPVFIKNLIKDLKEKKITTVFYLLFLISAIASTIFSIDKNSSILQLTLFFSCFVIFVSARSIFKDFKSKDQFALIFVLATALLSLISLYNTLVLNTVNKETDGVSFFWIYYGHNHISSLLIFSIPLCFYLLGKAFSKRAKVFMFIVSLILILSFLFSFARGSIVSFLIAFISAAILLKSTKFQKSVKSFVVIALVIAAIMLSVVIGAKFGVPKSPTFDSLRIQLWQESINNFGKNVLVGSGLNTFKIVSFNTSGISLKTYFAHNHLLQMLSDAGLFGFLSTFLLMFSLLFYSLKKAKKIENQREKLFYGAGFLGLFASIVNSMVDFNLELPAIFFIFSLIAGLL